MNARLTLPVGSDLSTEPPLTLRHSVLELKHHLGGPNGYDALCLHWDLDGTLVDSEPLHVRKLIEVSARHGVLLTEEDFNRTHQFPVPVPNSTEWEPASMALHGAGDKNMYHWAASQRPDRRMPVSMDAWLAELMDYFLAGAPGLMLRPGIAELVPALQELGAHQDLVTSATSAQLASSTEPLRPVRFALAFELDAQSVQRGKPNPEGYLAARARATAYWAARGVAEHRVLHVAVEDSPTGVRAALNAGLFCIQFLLPGQVPFGDTTGLLRAAKTASDICAILRILLVSGATR